MVHKLKFRAPFYAAVESGEKPFEVRRFDHDFAVGDLLHLYEVIPPQSGNASLIGWTGRSCWRRVTYVMRGGQFGIDTIYCALGLAAANDIDERGPFNRHGKLRTGRTHHYNGFIPTK